jgi:hypothetical protein
VHDVGRDARGALAGRFALALDGEALAFVAPHGQRIDWLPGARLPGARPPGAQSAGA